MPKDNQITANTGLYYVCYQLSLRGWNVMPTARNARGIDIVAYKGKDSKGFIGIQVKTLSKPRERVSLSNSLDKIAWDYWVIVTNVAAAPDVFVMLPCEVKEKAKQYSDSYWLQHTAYVAEKYQNKWDRLEVRGA